MQRAFRHARLITAIVVVTVLLGLLAVLNRNVDPEPTAVTAPAAWSLRPMTGGATVTLAFDTDSGWTRLTDSRSPGKELFFNKGRVLLPADLTDVVGRTTAFVSVPMATIFPPDLSFEPLELAPSLDRGPKECTVPSASENSYVQYFFGRAIPALSSQYVICGRSVFTDHSGGALIHAEDLSLGALPYPSPDLVIEVEVLGDPGQSLVARLRKEWANFGR
jgi:hypothetical protein